MSFDLSIWTIAILTSTGDEASDRLIREASGYSEPDIRAAIDALLDEIDADIARSSNPDD